MTVITRMVLIIGRVTGKIEKENNSKIILDANFTLKRVKSMSMCYG